MPQLCEEYSLVARVQLPEHAPAQLHFDRVQTECLSASVTVQAEAERELDCLSEPCRRRVLQPDTQEVEVVAAVR